MHRYSGKRRRGAWVVLLKCAVWLALGALVVALVMVLWNWLMPALFTGARVIDYWQAAALLVLSRILFGGRGGRWKKRGHRRHMRADERERLSRHFHGECGKPAGATDGAGEAQ